MTTLNKPVQSSFLVIGGGAAGTLAAARLLDESHRRGRPATVTVVESRESFGRGVAYATTDRRHVLNVPAYKMSAYPEDADHFLRWLEADGRRVDPCDFVARGWYGRYLEDVLEASQHRAGAGSLHRVHARAVDLEGDRDGCRVVLNDATTVDADAVVLALGHLGIDLSWVPPELAPAPTFIADPWSPEALAAVAPAADVLLVGTGLTMVDVVLALDRPGRVIHAVSRHGVLPRPHRPGLAPNMEAPEFVSAQPGLAELREAMDGHVAKALARYGDWRPAVDSVRSLTPKLWGGLTDAERREFVALDARLWEAVRHRIPPNSAAVVATAKRAGRLRPHTATVVAATTCADHIDVELSNGERLSVGAVVNCTGPCDQPTRSSEPLVRALLDHGHARPGPLGIGFDTTSDAQLMDVSGNPALPLWTLGALRKGALWESTAMPEIRVQAAAIARQLVKVPTGGTRRPSDGSGGRLSTTPAAADAWCRAMDAVRRVELGAPAALQEAVALDPSFAMGHAALALLGHEWGAPTDVVGSLKAATDAIQFRGDDRERSFVEMVLARLTRDGKTGDRKLLRHVLSHPRDCLAVSVALPTIAFSGLDQPIERSWELVERLRPAHGDDWWFSGILAFTRQEQQRWREAEELAERALAREPAAGHAVHARTHVCYETGEHVAGVSWLDGWITTHGSRSSHRAHFSWHVALHELALDDVDAARMRYVADLAPPRVTGPRALVDSASLLWRLRLLEAWPGELPIAPIVDSVDSCVFERPATAFAALHAAFGLAASGDVDGLAQLRRYAMSSPQSVMREVIPAICEGLDAVVCGRPAAAIEPLREAAIRIDRVGGSAAQHEIVTETLLFALTRANRTDDARALLVRRLSQRRSPSDERRLVELSR